MKLFGESFFNSLLSESQPLLTGSTPLTDSTIMGSGMGQIAVSLALVLSCFIVFMFLTKRFLMGPNKTTGTLHILDSLAIGMRERVILLQVGDEQVLIAATTQGIRTLHVIHRPQSVSPFNTHLSQAVDKQGNAEILS